MCGGVINIKFFPSGCFGLDKFAECKLEGLVHNSENYNIFQNRVWNTSNFRL